VPPIDGENDPLQVFAVFSPNRSSQVMKTNECETSHKALEDKEGMEVKISRKVPGIGRRELRASQIEAG